jgi:hypothetical protein
VQVISRGYEDFNLKGKDQTRYWLFVVSLDFTRSSEESNQVQANFELRKATLR